MVLYAVCALLVAMVIHAVDANIYASMASIESTVKIAKRVDIAAFFKTFIDSRMARLKHVNTILDTGQRIQDILDSRDVNLHHPTVGLAFRRFGNSIDDARRALQTEAPAMFANGRSLRYFMSHMPQQSDLLGTALGIAKLQHVYNISTSDLVNGVMAGRESRTLTTAEVLDFVNLTYDSSKIIQDNMLRVSLETLMYLNQTRGRDMSKADMTYLLLTMAKVYKHALCHCSMEYRNVLKQLKALDEIAADSLPIVRCKSVNKAVECGKLKANLVPLAEERLMKLCRGEEAVVPNFAQEYVSPGNRKMCMFVDNSQPYLLLQPAKVEILNDDNPLIAIAHDIIDQGEIDFIKSYAKGKLHRGTTINTQGLGQQVSYNKISQTFIMPMAVVDSSLGKFRARLFSLSGLNPRGFESITVANYGVGGLYNFHIDYLSPLSIANYTNSIDNRLVSMVTYLNDVDSGGATVFPELGIRSEAKKGNVLFFVNLFRNGTGNIMTRHASCPILYGEKWIGVQWVRRYGQEFAYPCSTSPWE